MFARNETDGSLPSALEETSDVDFHRMPDAELEEEFAELERAARMLEARMLRCLAEIDRRASFRADGHLSSTSWLAETYGAAPGAARDQVRTARALKDMPATAGAFARGEVSSSAVRVLASAHDAHPQAFCQHEGVLLEAALRHSVRGLRHAVSYWGQALDPEAALEESDRRWEARRLHVSPTLDGTVRIDGDLDPETGEVVLTAIAAVVDAELAHPDPEDRRTPAQRRVDAVGVIFRSFLDSPVRPTVGGERPHVSVIVDYEVLTGRRAGVAELDHGGPVHLEVARMLSCDASVRRVVFGPRSEPLDVGRSTDVVPAGMRRALVVRDGGCTFPRCDRPPPWTDAHHVHHWTRGGPTAVSNLTLLCRRHHGLVHRKRFGVHMVDGRPVFTRPDGSVLEGRERFVASRARDLGPKRAG